MKEDVFNDQLQNKGLIVFPGSGETYDTKGISIRFKITSEDTADQFGVYEINLAPHTIGAKLHYHRFMDETFIVQEGTVSIQVGEYDHVAKEGTVAYIPRFTPHGFRNDSDRPARLLLLFNPAQKREGFFRGLHETLSENPVDENKFLKLYNKYDSYPIDSSDIIQTNSKGIER